jgi:hypothetical protein
MTTEFIEVDLNNEEKQAILEHADFFVTEEVTKKDLQNKRKKWIRFTADEINDVVGELSYYFNRTKNDQEFYFLDELIGHLENYI